jgi:hypothetical protein
MTTLLIVVSGLFVAFIFFVLIRSGIKRRKFLKNLEIGSYVDVYDGNSREISSLYITEIDSLDETVKLSDGYRYSFDNLLD